jgi:hypothetical protein
MAGRLSDGGPRQRETWARSSGFLRGGRARRSPRRRSAGTETLRRRRSPNRRSRMTTIPSLSANVSFIDVYNSAASRATTMKRRGSVRRPPPSREPRAAPRRSRVRPGSRVSPARKVARLGHLEFIVPGHHLRVGHHAVKGSFVRIGCDSASPGRSTRDGLGIIRGAGPPRRARPAAFAGSLRESASIWAVSHVWTTGEDVDSPKRTFRPLRLRPAAPPAPSNSATLSSPSEVRHE